MKLFYSNIRNSKGQGILEYVIITGLIGILTIGLVRSFGDVVRTRITEMKKQVVENLQLGK